MQVFIQQLTIIIRYSVIADSWKKYKEKYSRVTFHPNCKKSVIKTKYVFCKKKKKLKITKGGMKKKVQFHLHLFKESPKFINLINLER
jgi:muramidase (phage lysozyme)